MSLTAAQQEAIAARGNVLVVAGAGTGKTRTLVERCLGCLLDEKPRASLDEILMVTFTDAAAAEMRQRIRDRLQEEAEKRPGEAHWQEQLALFETAHIGTLHSFCLELVRQHFYELELDPQLSVLTEEEASLLAEETLEALLQKHYAGRGSAAEAVQQLIQTQGRGWDQPIRELVLRLHHYTQTLPDPAGWVRGQLALFGAREPNAWQQWLLKAAAEWRERWLPLLQAQAGAGEIAGKCAAALAALKAAPSRGEAAAAFQTILAAARDCPHGKKTLWLKPLEDFLAETSFLASLAGAAGKPDPLAEDWGWVRGQMATLLELTREFTEAFTDAKRELGMVDFHDLEQYALRLLWDPQANQPTKVARQWRKKLRFVFVDEYQDINAAQDKIIEALSRQGAQANRFLVGDVKQSIYRFRLANPYIFQGYVEKWGSGTGVSLAVEGVPPSNQCGPDARTGRRDACPTAGQGVAIPLVDNFRSREGILDFLNSLFGIIMQREIGGVAYDERTRLRFGAPEERRALSVAAGSGPCVELRLRVRGNADSQEADEEAAEALAEVRDLEEADKEARLVALRLRELKAGQHPVWDEEAGRFRPVEWRDMAVLLRSPSNKSESYAKEFSRLNVPLQVARGGFYQSLEISDLLSLLQVLDNPLQDLPVLAVLHSPLVGLTLDELAAIRITVTKTHFWTALLRWQEAQSTVHSPESTVHAPRTTHHAPRTTSSPTYRKVTTFLDRFARWRRLARQVSLSRCLEAVLSETHYAAWLLTQPRGEQRHANVQRLLALAQQFDQFQRQGLFRFLRFIEAQRLAETEPDVAPVSEENAVRLMSIHQSKGLEFPVVVVADLGKPFNLLDLRAEIILDEEYGLCPQIKPPHTGKRYPSLPYWLARRRQARELLGEELRLLYVAMTRARDALILSANVSASCFNKLWRQKGELNPAALLAARSYADWLGLWFSRNAGLDGDGALEGQTACLRWVIQDDARLLARQDAAPAAGPDQAGLTAEPEVWQRLHQRLSWRYFYTAATRQPAKTSVSALRRRAAAGDAGEAVGLFQSSGHGPQAAVHSPQAAVQGSASGRLTAAEVGNAHHSFLQLVSLERVGSPEALKQEARRFQQEGALSAEEAKALDFEGLAAFWDSDLGRRVRTQAPFVRRELAFTARFAPEELARLTGEPPDPSLDEEFVVVQGVADLAVVLPQEIWLIDFKTDGVAPDELADRARTYEPQLRLYARALSQIYRRPVSECWLYFLARHEAVAVKPG